MRRWLLALLLVHGTVSCAEQETGALPQLDGTFGPGHPLGVSDAGASPSTGTLTLGRCVRADTAGECTGVVDEPTKFLPFAEGDSLSTVVGPQGSTMFIFLARTDGIHPGDPGSPTSTDNPNIELRLVLSDTDEMLAALRARSSFELEPVSQRLQTTDSLFLVVDNVAARLVDQPLRVESHLVDRDGVTRDGELTFLRVP